MQALTVSDDSGIVGRMSCERFFEVRSGLVANSPAHAQVIPRGLIDERRLLAVGFLIGLPSEKLLNFGQFSHTGSLCLACSATRSLIDMFHQRFRSPQALEGDFECIECSFQRVIQRLRPAPLEVQIHYDWWTAS
jgi:hypothetical protein